MAAFTREPSGRRASTSGDDSSTRRPTRETTFSMMRSRWAASLNSHGGAVQFAAALHVYQTRGGHQNIGDRRILQQRLERPQAEYLIENFLDNAVLLHQAERRLLFFDQLGHCGPNLGAHALAGHRRQ